MKRMFFPVALAMSCSTAAWAQQAARQQSGQSQQQQPTQSAQQQQNNERFDRGAARTSTTGDAQSAQHGEQQLKQMLALANQNEIEMAEFAQQRAVSPEVKQFAQMMIKDHQQYLQKLGVQQTRSSGKASQSDRPSTSQQANDDRSDAARQSNTTAQNSTNRPAEQSGTSANQQAGNQSNNAQSRQQGGQIDFVQLKREAGERCLQMTQKMLSEKSGQEFDKCYIGSQVGAHVEMLAMLQAAENHVSDELKQTVQQGIQTTQHHLQEAQQIAQQFEQNGGQRGGSQQPNRANQGQGNQNRQQNSSNNP